MISYHLLCWKKSFSIYLKQKAVIDLVTSETMLVQNTQISDMILVQNIIDFHITSLHHYVRDNTDHLVCIYVNGILAYGVYEP